MRAIKDFPIATKLIIAFALTVAIALSLATIFFVVSSSRGEIEKARAQLQATADLIGSNTSAALAFGDAKTAAETLATLSVVPDIFEAVLYDQQGREFAHYLRRAGDENGAPDASRLLTAESSVVLDGQTIGRVVLTGMLQQRLARLRRDIAFSIGVSFFSFVVAIGIALYLQRAITHPIKHLTGALQKVSADRDYGIRVTIRRRDELGVLADGINEMLGRVQERDAELARRGRELEETVAARTLELRTVNERLTEELAAHQRAEVDLRVAHAALAKHLQESAILAEMNEHMQVCRSVGETFPVISHYVHRLFPDGAGSVNLINRSRSLVEPVSSWGGPGGEPFRQDECWALRRGRVYGVDIPAEGLVCPHCRADVAGPYVCIPMTAYGDVLGVLHLRFASGREFPEDMKQLGSRAAEQLALTLANLRLHETLEAQSVRDPLTMLYNRRFLQESLERELARAARTQSHVAVLMLDIDHFKNFNDVHGHEAGDLVLVEIGRFLQHSVRQGDIACRYGGEEFTLVLPGADPVHAMERADDVRRGAKAIVVEYQGKRLEGTTMSLGIAVYPLDGTTAEELLRAADSALYSAKNMGRDRCVLAPGARQGLGGGVPAEGPGEGSADETARVSGGETRGPDA